MMSVALKMLLGNTTKYTLLVSGICVATILMIQGLALFSGMLTFSYSTITNVRSPLWIFDPTVQQVGDNQPLRDAEIYKVRSVSGVDWAAPLFVGNAQAKLLSGGSTRVVTLIGLDDDTLAGAPTQMIAGDARDLRLPDSVIVEKKFIDRTLKDRGVELKIGDFFEMNEKQALIVGIANVAQGFGGSLSVFTTWSRAKNYIPKQRKMLTHLLVSSKKEMDPQDVIQLIRHETGLNAVTEEEFKKMSIEWMIRNSPVPFIVGIIVLIGLLVGISISGQTFYSFIQDNNRYWGIIKALGASHFTLMKMVCIQAFIVGIVGYGIGSGLITVFFSALPEGTVPYRLDLKISGAVFFAVMMISFFSTILGLMRVIKIDPAIVFRG